MPAEISQASLTNLVKVLSQAQKLRLDFHAKGLAYLKDGPPCISMEITTKISILEALPWLASQGLHNMKKSEVQKELRHLFRTMVDQAKLALHHQNKERHDALLDQAQGVLLAADRLHCDIEATAIKEGFEAYQFQELRRPEETI